MLRVVAACVLAATLCTYTRPWGPPLQWKLPSMLESDTRVDACIERPSVLCRVDTSPAIILNTSMEGSFHGSGGPHGLVYVQSVAASTQAAALTRSISEMQMVETTWRPPVAGFKAPATQKGTSRQQLQSVRVAPMVRSTDPVRSGNRLSDC